LKDQSNPSDSEHVDREAKDAIPSDEIDVIEEAFPSRSPVAVRNRPRLVPPFIPMHDIPRGIFHGVQLLLSYALMLVIM